MSRHDKFLWIQVNLSRSKKNKYNFYKKYLKYYINILFLNFDLKAKKPKKIEMIILIFWKTYKNKINKKQLFWGHTPCSIGIKMSWFNPVLSFFWIWSTFNNKLYVENGFSRFLKKISKFFICSLCWVIDSNLLNAVWGLYFGFTILIKYIFTGILNSISSQLIFLLFLCV